MTAPSSIPPIPVATRNAAKSAYSSDNFFLIVGGRLAALLGDTYQNGFHSTELISRREKPPLTIVTIFQFIEKLSDDQAAEATRMRVDWKYALHLSMNYSGLPATSLCEYRQWVLQEPARQHSFRLILDRLVDNDLLVGYQNQSHEVRAVLDEVCSVTRLDKIFKAMQLAIGALATRQPEWLRTVALPHWYERYHWMTAASNPPKTKGERESLARSIGADASYLLEAFRRHPSQDPVLAEILDLEEMLNRHFIRQHGDLSWRAAGCAYCQN